jgi:hypothetical protein
MICVVRTNASQSLNESISTSAVVWIHQYKMKVGRRLRLEDVLLLNSALAGKNRVRLEKGG